MKIECSLTHREMIKKIMELVVKYTNAPHCPGTDYSWIIGINENGEPDATCDALQDHFNTIGIPVVFYDTTASGEIDLKGNCEMSAEEKYDWYIEEFMNARPEGFENLKFKKISQKETL